MAVEDNVVLGYLIDATVERLKKRQSRPICQIERIKSVLGLYKKLRKY